MFDLKPTPAAALLFNDLLIELEIQQNRKCCCKFLQILLALDWTFINKCLYVVEMNHAEPNWNRELRNLGV